MKIQAALVKPPRSRPQIRRNQRNGKALKNKLAVAAPSLLALLGGLCGGVLLHSLAPSELVPGLQEHLTHYFSASDSSFGAALWASLPPSVGFGLLIVYLGASPVGTPAIAALLFLRGCAFGALAAFLASFGKAGLSFYFAGLFPTKVVQLCGLFLVSRCAMLLSGYYKSCLKRDSFHPDQITGGYLVSCLPGLLLLLVSAAADAFVCLRVSPSFGSLAC